MAYKDGLIYLMGTRYEDTNLIRGTYIYDIDENQWTFREIEHNSAFPNYLNSLCIDKDSLYLYSPNTILSLNLSSDKFEFQDLKVDLI